MAIFKCKMCGGTLVVNQGESTGVCAYCGTKQTLPRLDDERKINLYDRANHFRRNNDFDKAMGIYEQILNEDSTDAEAYWSLVLCRYGIEYVEDPATHKRVPTVNRAQYTSIYADEDYKSALQYADTYQKSIYEAEAKAIDEIQKGILEISQKEEPFDVFICYKETGNDGRRTPDSVLATELYHELTREGFKVFFSRITLEDKLGTAYEPYIFAALHSAKVMVALGTKPEYFNAVWVKNEWSRFLALIKAGERKTLIPAYKDMDPYDLPEEFSHLQAQDMSKLGFMSDLVRGINKILASGKETVAKETVIVNNSGNASVAPLLERAFMFLEDGDWQSADEYCEKVLDIEPKNAEAYLGKLMAELQVRKEADLAKLEQPFDDNSNFQKAVRFGSEEFAQKLNGYLEHINARNEENRLNALYSAAFEKMKKADSETEYKDAADCFEKISGFKDAAEKAKQCLEQVEACKEKIYNRAKEEMQVGELENYKRAIVSFKRVLDYKDSRELEKQCRQLIERVKIQNIYEEAKAEMNSGFYQRAAYLFNNVCDYKDAKVLAEECEKKYIAAGNDAIYNRGKTYMESNNKEHYLKAINEFEKISGWKDSNEKINECGRKIEQIKEKEKADCLAAEKAAKKKKKIVAIVAAIVAVMVAFVIVLITVIIPTVKKNEFIKQYGQKAYDTFGLVEKGEYIKFGSYEQDNNTSNGKEDVEWLVLAKLDNKALIVSKYALDCQPYNSTYTNITWKDCSLRKWLNETFYNEVFGEEHKKLIVKSTVTADKNPDYSTSPGSNTSDNVFLLSITEVNKYFGGNSARQCQGTAYCYALGALKGDNGNCCWWLRSPGKYSDSAVCVDVDGSVLTRGGHVDRGVHPVRPALWIKIDGSGD